MAAVRCFLHPPGREREDGEVAVLLWPCAMIGSTVAEILTRLSEAEARPASGVARRAAGARRALCNLACDEAAKAAIVDAIPQLVALLSGGMASTIAA